MKIGAIEFVPPGFNDSSTERTRKKLTALIGSIEGTYPMNRLYGIKSEILDYPVNIARTMLAADIYDKAERFIPDINIVDIDFHMDLDEDVLYPIIEYEEIEAEDDGEALEDDGDSEEDEYEAD